MLSEASGLVQAHLVVLRETRACFRSNFSKVLTVYLLTRYVREVLLQYFRFIP
jgi:hypothetical protein